MARISRIGVNVKALFNFVCISDGTVQITRVSDASLHSDHLLSSEDARTRRKHRVVSIGIDGRSHRLLCAGHDVSQVH